MKGKGAKIAVCLSGEMRDYENCYKPLRHYLSNYDCDYFICTWDEIGGKGPCYDKTKVNRQDIIDKYDPKVLNIQSKKDWDSNKFISKKYGGARSVHHPNGAYVDFISQYQTWYKLSLLFEKYINEGHQYDFVIRSRPDLKIVGIKEQHLLNLGADSLHENDSKVYCCEGTREDDGLESLKADCLSGFDLIHIDPWKKYQTIEAAAEITVNYIKYCHSINNEIKYEVGTEAAIRKYTTGEFRSFLQILDKKLGNKFESIKYAVIQGGTAIVGNKNIGNFNSKRCEQMVSVCKEFNLLSKEHNGDYLYGGQIRKRFDCALDAINIAPEFGFIETSVILNEIINNLDCASYNKFYETCYNSKKWVKWLPANISDVPEEIRKLAILRTAGHYVFNTETIRHIKNQYPDIDTKIENAIVSRINEILDEIV